MTGSRGRKVRKPIERARTAIWAESVRQSARRSYEDLESVLGDDGRWSGIWSRYTRGAVSPSRERILRIDEKLPGTARYYFSPLWALHENRMFTWFELREAIGALDERLGVLFVGHGEIVQGRFWRVDFQPVTVLEILHQVFSDQALGLDAITAALVLVRDAELRQDAVAYLLALVTWAKLENLRYEHLIFRKLPNSFIDAIAEPIRDEIFANAKLQALWNHHVTWYCEKRNASKKSFEIIDCLNSMNFNSLYRALLPDVDLTGSLLLQS